MQIDTADKLMQFRQRYAGEVVGLIVVPNNVLEFVTKAFHSLAAVFGDSLKSCVFVAPCTDHRGCHAECANSNISDFTVKLSQSDYVPHFFSINITRNESFFHIWHFLYSSPHGFSYSSNPVGKISTTRISLHENQPFSWESSHSNKKADGLASKKEGGEDATCDKDSILECQAALLDDFKSSLEEFRKDAMADKNTGTSQTTTTTPPTTLGLGAVLAGVGVIGGGLGLLYSKYRSQKQKPLSNPSIPMSGSIRR